MSTTNTHLPTWFDRLPTEIIFIIFNYLSSNDIIYAFFHFNHRFNNILLQNQSYLKHFRSPITNLDEWENILSIIGSQIESLHIDATNFPFSLEIFPNVKSLIISLPFNSPTETLNMIFKSEQFQHLHSLKIKEHEILSDRFNNNYPFDKNDTLNKFFNHENSLNMFQCLSMTSIIRSIDTESFQTKPNLHSLTLILRDFRDIFTLIPFIPNLEYLNIQAISCSMFTMPMNTSNFKLKKFHSLSNWNKQAYSEISSGNLKLKKLDFSVYLDKQPCNGPRLIGFTINEITNCIKYISTSLTCLSLNLVGVNDEIIRETSFHHLELQHFLNSMTELKQFHFYAKLPHFSYNKQNFLLEFKTQFWYDRNLFFGMHDDYFYTLPFHFHCLHDIPEKFDEIPTTNDEILRNNSQIWYHIKSIQLNGLYVDMNKFIKKLKMKMPKLSSVKFKYQLFFDEEQSRNLTMNNNQTKQIDLILENVTTIKVSQKLTQDKTQLICDALPNFKHLILSSRELFSVDRQLTEILNKNIRILDIDLGNFNEQLIERNFSYFSNVQYVNCCSYHMQRDARWQANLAMNFLRNCQNLQILSVYAGAVDVRNSKSKLNNIIQWLDMGYLDKNYQIKSCDDYILFIKK